VNTTGLWEHGNYILLRMDDDKTIATRNGISVESLQQKVQEIKKLLMAERSKRIYPGLDDKQLTSWNALMIKGYCKAYEAFANTEFLDAAVRGAEHILQKVKRDDGGLYHSYKNGKARINGYLEDYCFFMEALMSLYEITFDEKYLGEARKMEEYVTKHFYDESTSMYFFTSNLDKELIARKKEIHDNVIPASNSSMATVPVVCYTTFNMTCLNMDQHSVTGDSCCFGMCFHFTKL
jgi:uncharacterized protein YyaL (SSP411 family)